jgi:hypothetical protein
MDACTPARHNMSRALRQLYRTVAALAIASMWATTVAASEHAGQITVGGVAIPGALVTATRGEQRFTAVSDLQGVYRFTGLAEGTWTLRIEMLGFYPATHEVNVPSDAPTIWVLRIAPAESKASLPPGLTVDGRVARPSGIRSDTPPSSSTGFASAKLNPTAAARLITDEPPPDGMEAAQVAAASQDSVLINGSFNNDAGSPTALPPSFGNNRPSRRSRLYGSAATVFGHSSLDARPFSFTADQARKPSYADWQWQGTLGGLIRLPWLTRNPSTFYLGFERTSDTAMSTHSVLVPSELERRGNFSQSRNSAGQPVQVHDPISGLPFAENAIPAGRISPQAATLLQYYPRPNVEGARFNYQSPVVVDARRTALQSRLSHSPSSRARAVGALNYRGSSAERGTAFGFTDSTSNSGLDATINWTHRFTRFFSLRARYQFTRLSAEVVPHFAGRTNVSGDAGISGNSQESRNWGPPSLVFSSGLAGLSDTQYALSRDRTHSWALESVWNRGAHTLTLGGGGRRQLFDVQAEPNARGMFSFTGAFTGSDLGDFLLGIPQSSSVAFGNPDKQLRGGAVDVYVNDDWRVNSRFTVNAGVRWEYEAPFTEHYGRLANLDLMRDFSIGALVTAETRTGSVTGRRLPESLLFSDLRGIQPRLGVAWRPRDGSSLVVRGGYGIYRLTNLYRSIALLMTEQPPYVHVVNAENSASDPFTLANGFGLPSGSGTPTFAVSPDLRVGTAQNWQGSIQQDLPASVTVLARYEGVKGSQLMQQILPNTNPPGASNPCPACPTGFVYLQSQGSSLRHAFVGQLRRRLRDGLTATIQYKLSKATDDAAALTGPALVGSAIAQDWLNPDAEHAVSNFDQRHQMTAHVEYSTGIGLRGGGLVTGWKGRLLQGWTLAADVTAGSGLPVTPIYLRSVSGTAIIGTIRARFLGPPGDRPAGFYFDPDAFAPPQTGQWGTARRNSLRGPKQFNLNAGLSRTFELTNRWRLEWRADATNVLNSVTYAGVNALVSSSQFGLPNRANPMRQIRTSLKLRF